MAITDLLRRGPIAFVFAGVAALAVVIVSEGSYRRSLETLGTLSAVGAARAQIQGLERSILDAETGQRGYLLTGQAEHREPYDAALAQIDEAYRFLRQHYRRDPHSLVIVERAREVTAQRLSELALTMRLFEEGKDKATGVIVRSNIGKEQMDAIRALSEQLLQIEATRVDAQRVELERTLLGSRIGVAVLSGLTLLALLMYLRQTSALQREQRQQQRIVAGERDRLEVEVTRRTAQLTELARHLETAREDERSRLARDLHDELGALLTSAKLDAARLRPRLAGAAPEALERLEHQIATLNSGIALKRRIIEDLRPSSLRDLGLAPTLQALARDHAGRCGVQMECRLEPVALEPGLELVVYRIVQEALTNIAKHARARRVVIELESRDGEALVAVRDDGVGFDATALSDRGGHGLAGMRVRVESEGGRWSIESTPGRGTTIRVALPDSTTATD